MDQFARTELLIGHDAIETLHAARVAVFGIGGVGGNAAEALVRCGVGSIDLFDDDKVCLTNLNRQVIAVHSTIGQNKVDVMEARLKDINPKVQVTKHALFYLPDVADTIDLSCFDYIIDAVDTVTAKLELITRADRLGVPIISAMGAGNRLDPTQLKIGDLYETSTCRLARVMRREARRRGIRRLTVAYSTEEPIKVQEDASISCRYHCVCPPGTTRKCTARRDIPGSIAFVPPAMGLLIASKVARDLIENPPARMPMKKEGSL
ncbi:MAG: tRNA threonylcarbamoyladenosine dehydratase [Clostridia bacterium]|nr:tRNA threonylcarbamoyladenosine dehydratase [Clostridia bacterium]